MSLCWVAVRAAPSIRTKLSLGCSLAVMVAVGTALAGCPSRETLVAAPIAEITVPSASAASAASGAPRVVDGGAPRASAEGIVGRWTGVGTQGDGQTWEMHVEITSTQPGRCGTVEYPSIPCSADWICLSGSSGRTVRAREDLTDGVGRCIDHGTMTMTLAPDGTLDWRWTGSGERASAKLTRP